MGTVWRRVYRRSRNRHFLSEASKEATATNTRPVTVVPPTTRIDARLGFSRAGRDTSDTARAAVLCGIALLEHAPCRGLDRELEVPNQCPERKHATKS